MSKELKIRLQNSESILLKLDLLGAPRMSDTTYEYTYFNQPEGKVLKLTTYGGKTFKTVIERQGNRFIVKSSDEVNDTDKLAAQLTRQYGVKRHLVNHRSIFYYDDLELSTNNIEGVGVFLIIEGNDPQLNFATEILGIKNPEIITDSFDNL